MTIPKHVILLVEDSADDVFFMRYALKKAGIAYPLLVVTDGQQALDYLSGSGPYADRTRFPLPTIVFLDLKLPFLNGFEVFAWLRSQPALGQLPVLILTGSSEVRDREKARAFGAKAYLVKPPDQEMLRQAFDSIPPESQS